MVDIRALLENDVVINSMFRDLTLKRLDSLLAIVEKLRDEKAAEAQKSAGEEGSNPSGS